MGKNSDINIYFNFQLTKKRSNLLYVVRNLRKSNEISKYYTDENGYITVMVKKKEDGGEKLKVTYNVMKKGEEPKTLREAELLDIISKSRSWAEQSWAHLLLNLLLSLYLVNTTFIYLKTAISSLKQLSSASFSICSEEVVNMLFIYVQIFMIHTMMWFIFVVNYFSLYLPQSKNYQFMSTLFTLSHVTNVTLFRDLCTGPTAGMHAMLEGGCGV